MSTNTTEFGIVPRIINASIAGIVGVRKKNFKSIKLKKIIIFLI